MHQHSAIMDVALRPNFMAMALAFKVHGLDLEGLWPWPWGLV